METPKKPLKKPLKRPLINISSKVLVERRQTPHAFMYGEDHDEPTNGGRPMCAWCSLPGDAIIHKVSEDLDEDGDEIIDLDDGGIDEAVAISTIQVARIYLESAHSTLWGRSWNIKDARNREEAARWLTKEVDRINAIRNMAIHSSSTLREIVERARRMEA